LSPDFTVEVDVMGSFDTDARRISSSTVAPIPYLRPLAPAEATIEEMVEGFEDIVVGIACDTIVPLLGCLYTWETET
jgi:hypothetical protein